MQDEVQDNYKPKLLKYIKLQEEFLQADKLQELLDILGKAKKQKKSFYRIFNCKRRRKNQFLQNY